jgi:protoporphyrinogen oxidase
MKIAVIGAGPAGITAAYQISKKISGVDVYEASDAVGGLSKTIDLWNQKVDLGPHRFFSSDKIVNQLWLEVVGNDYRMVDRLTRIYYKNRFFHYPLKAADALKNLGIIEAFRCMLSYLSVRLSGAKPGADFESWVTARFGKRLFDIFFKTYSEKLWGISCKELDADFAAQRIKKLSLFEALKNALFGGGNSKHKTLVDRFAYPIGGTGMVYERMGEKIKTAGGRIFLKTPVQRILTKDGKAYAIEFPDGRIEQYDHIISTMPLTQMVMRLPEVPQEVKDSAQNLKFRNTILVYLNVKAKNLFPDNWLYVHSDDLKMGRITNFRNWVPQLYDKEESSILVSEYWCYDEDKFMKMPKEDIIQLAKEELRKTGLIKEAEISEGHVHVIPKCYPVYSTGYKQYLKPVEQYLSAIENLTVIGRYGAFKYNNQDHSILMGILAAENILDKKDHNLWDVNTDYESYQESSVITETGLEIN